MRKLTTIGVFENIHHYTAELLKMQGKNTVSEIEEKTDARKYLSKSVLVMGNVNVNFLKDVMPRARAIIYIGNDDEVKTAIRNYAIEKDIPQQVENVSLSATIESWYSPLKTLEIYSSVIFSEMELANKYMMNTGPLFSLLVKYISQIELVRNTAIFDHDNYDDLKDLHKAFNDYHEKKIAAGENYDQDELLDIFNVNRP